MHQQRCTAWWQRFRNGSWVDAWAPVLGTYSASGLGVAGDSHERFQVYHRGSNRELIQGSFDGEFDWRTVPGAFDGTPVVRRAHAEWWEVYVRAEGMLLDYFRWFGTEGWAGRASIASDPAVASWSDESVFVFARNAESKLRWFWFSMAGAPPTVDVDMNLPPGSLTAVARNPGHFDLIVSEPGQPI